MYDRTTNAARLDQGNAVTPLPPQQTMGKRIIEHLDNLISSARDANARSEVIANRLFGALPVSPETVTGKGEAATLEAEIFNRLECLHALLNDQHHQLDRISNI